jgi:hypothetical protein
MRKNPIFAFLNLKVLRLLYDEKNIPTLSKKKKKQTRFQK